MIATPLDDLLTRAANLRRQLADARNALARDTVFDLSRVRYEVESLCEIALSLAPEQRGRATQVLEALDADLAATAQHLEAWRETTLSPQQGDQHP